MADAAHQPDGRPISEVIRQRVQAAGQRFHANDNISAFIQVGELGTLLDEVTEKMQAVLDSLDHFRICQNWTFLRCSFRRWRQWHPLGRPSCAYVR